MQKGNTSTKKTTANLGTRSKKTKYPDSLILIKISTILVTLYVIAWIVFMIIFSINQGNIFGAYGPDCTTVACGAQQSEGLGFALLPLWLAGLIVAIPVFILDLLALLGLENAPATRRRRIGTICGCQAILAIVIFLCIFLDMQIFLLAYWLQTGAAIVLCMLMSLVAFFKSKKKTNAA